MSMFVSNGENHESLHTVRSFAVCQTWKVAQACLWTIMFATEMLG